MPSGIDPTCSISFDISKSNWGHIGGHHVFYRWNRYYQRYEAILGDSIGGSRCQAAANDAISLVGKKGSGQERKYYEAAAVCLGGVSHYIGDLAHFDHVYDNHQWSHTDSRWAGFESFDTGKFLDSFVYTDLSTKFTSSSQIIPYSKYGGPNWHNLDPSKLRLINPTTQQIGNLIDWTGNKGTTDKLTHLISPKVAAFEMSWIAFSGRDPENRIKDESGQYIPLPSDQLIRGYLGGDVDPNLLNETERFLGSSSAYTLPSCSGMSDSEPDSHFAYKWSISDSSRRFDSYSDAVNAAKKRIQKTVSWAVYYTACALLWTLMQMDIPDDTTELDRVGGGGNGDLGKEPVSQEKIFEYWEGKYRPYQRGNSYYNVDTVIAGVMTSLVIILPVAALAVVPGAVKTINNHLKKKEDSKFPESDETNQGIFHGISNPIAKIP